MKKVFLIIGVLILIKGLYEELRFVEAGDDDYDPNEDTENYIDEEEAQKYCGHIFIGYKSNLNDYLNNEDSQFQMNWHKLLEIRQLCQTLPKKCTFRRISMFREISYTCEYKYVLVIEVNQVLVSF